MHEYLSIIEKIKEKLIILRKEKFIKADSGTNHKVFLSDNYAIRFHETNPKLLFTEANLLKKINHILIPKIIWIGKIDKMVIMLEKRLPGKTIDVLWKTIPTRNKSKIIKEIVEFIFFLQNQTKEYVYSVKTGKKYKTFLDYLDKNVEKKIIKLKKIPEIDEVLNDLLDIINNPKLRNLFIKTKKISLVHGDLIIHNLLTDASSLTGVLDWELALFGDPDYDLARIFYYQECAKAYQEQGTDDTFEADFTKRLTDEILKSKLITNKKKFTEKYKFIRAIFYVDSLFWAINSDSPKLNIKEILDHWKKSN